MSHFSRDIISNDNTFFLDQYLAHKIPNQNSVVKLPYLMGLDELLQIFTQVLS